MSLFRAKIFVPKQIPFVLVLVVFFGLFTIVVAFPKATNAVVNTVEEVYNPLASPVARMSAEAEERAQKEQMDYRLTVERVTGREIRSVQNLGKTVWAIAPNLQGNGLDLFRSNRLDGEFVNVSTFEDRDIARICFRDNKVGTLFNWGGAPVGITEDSGKTVVWLR